MADDLSTGVEAPDSKGKRPAGRMERVAGQARQVRGGLRHSRNWAQLMRFALVGGVGYVVNLLVFALLVHPLRVHYMMAAVLAFCVAVTNNFVLNRHWTFNAADGRAGLQGVRFFIVSLVALVFNLLVLSALVMATEIPKVMAQAIAIAWATPLNFVGNKLWTFHGPDLRLSERK